MICMGSDDHHRVKICLGEHVTVISKPFRSFVQGIKHLMLVEVEIAVVRVA